MAELTIKLTLTLTLTIILYSRLYNICRRYFRVQCIAGFRACQEVIDRFFYYNFFGVYPYFSQSLKHISYITYFIRFFSCFFQSFNLDVYFCFFVFCPFYYLIYKFIKKE